MGDLGKKKEAKKDSLAQKMKDREERKQETVHLENETIDNLLKKKRKIKDKPISARVNGNTYELFQKICEAKGLTSNACLNMLITEYVREYKNIIE